MNSAATIQMHVYVAKLELRLQGQLQKFVQLSISQMAPLDGFTVAPSFFVTDL